MNHFQSRSRIKAAAVRQPEPAPGDPLSAACEFHGAVNALFSLQLEAGQAFDQDYRAWVLYTAFMVASAADTLRDMGGRDGVGPGRPAGFAPGVLSAQSLSEMTGIPRETVRRKCLALAERGVLKMDPSGYFRLEVNPETASQAAQRFNRISPAA